jgi:hypothetical protein
MRRRGISAGPASEAEVTFGADPIGRIAASAAATAAAGRRCRGVFAPLPRVVPLPAWRPSD